MKQELICTACTFIISRPLLVCDSQMENCLPLDRGCYDMSFVPSGICFKSDVNILAAEKVITEFARQETKSGIFKRIIKRKKIALSLKNLETEVQNNHERVEHSRFFHLKYSPQYWMNAVDLSREVEVEEISWGWKGTNKPNVFCPNCDEPIGTDIMYVNTPTVFIPDSEKTKWQNVES